MPNTALDTVIAVALASGRPAEYEAIPENFSPATNRFLLRESLAALGGRHTRIEIRLFGALRALQKFGLEAGETLVAGALRIPVSQGMTRKYGALRFVVAPLAGPSSGPSAA